MTLYDSIFELFLDKIVEDTDFFMYDLPQDQAESIINKRCNSFLDYAVKELKNTCKADVDFSDRDNTLQQFNFYLTDVEQGLIVDLMFYDYLNRDIAKLKVLKNYFTSKDLKSWSPANERNSFTAMLKDMRKQITKDIKEYESRDRLTGKYKLLDFSQQQ